MAKPSSGTVFTGLAVALLVALLLGWYTFFVDGDRAGVDVNPDEIGEDLEKAGDVAGEVGEKVGEGVKKAAEKAKDVEVDVEVETD